MNKKTLILTAALASLCLTAPALAQSTDPIFSLQQNESLLYINATEQREVTQDLLTAELRIEVEHEDNKSVQNEINTAMAKALEIAKKYADVKTSTRGYMVQQYDKNLGRKNLPVIMVWKGTQSLQLKSKNAEALLELAGKIQDAGLSMSALDYDISPELAAQIQDEMLEAALAKLSSRAKRAASALGKTSVELKEINTQGNYLPVAPKNYARAEMMMASDAVMAAPVATPGETIITMSVDAKALLR